MNEYTHIVDAVFDTIERRKGQRPMGYDHSVNKHPGKAALILQALARGVSIRRAKWAVDKAATLIQKVVRGHQKRNISEQMRAAEYRRKKSTKRYLHQLRETLKSRQNTASTVTFPGLLETDIDVLIPIDDCYPAGWVENFRALQRNLLARNSMIEQISIGSCHTIALSNRGDCYIWGWNDYGQIGNDNITSSTLPRMLRYQASFSRVKIKQVAAGADFSAILDRAGRIFTFGSNKRGQLGLSTSKPTVSSPRLVGILKHYVKKIGVGENFTIALTDRGDIYSWGASACLGLAQSNEDRFSPKHVPLSSRRLIAVDIACGNCHTLILARDFRGPFQGNVVYSFGMNVHGQLGLGDRDPRFAPTRVPLRGFPEAITAGSKHSLVLAREFVDQNGKRQFDLSGNVGEQVVFTFGSNKYGELGTGDTVLRTKPAIVRGLLTMGKRTRIVQVSCGARNSCVLLRSGDGWNEHWRTVWGMLGRKRFCNPTTVELPGAYADSQCNLQISSAFSRSYSVNFLEITANKEQFLSGSHQTLRSPPFLNELSDSCPAWTAGNRKQELSIKSPSAHDAREKSAEKKAIRDFEQEFAWA